MGPNGSMYAAESALMQHSIAAAKALSPSHQAAARPSHVNRHLVDLSSGSTCCSSSTSSSPHTLMQGPPPVPSLPQSMAQGVMLFTSSDLTSGGPDATGSSPSHYAAQYPTHSFHPYLNSHASTLPRHYDANMSLTGASPLKLYSQEQIMVWHLWYTPCQLVHWSVINFFLACFDHLRWRPIHSCDCE